MRTIAYIKYNVDICTIKYDQLTHFKKLDFMKATTVINLFFFFIFIFITLLSIYISATTGNSDILVFSLVPFTLIFIFKPKK